MRRGLVAMRVRSSTGSAAFLADLRACAGRQFLGYAFIALGLAFIDGRLPRTVMRKLTGPGGSAADSRLPTGENPR